ncbi:MAG: hypothetical protein ACQCN6_10640 [Candidatus Bathyarchaeia archaeon]
MKHDERTLERIYEKDKATDAFIISIALDRYVDVFNELDSAPWRRRDLDHDLRIFLEDCSSDIPLKYDIIIQFNVEQEKRDPIKEERLKVGLKTYFTFVRSNLQKRIRRSYERSLIYGVVAFFLIFVSYSLAAVSINPLLASLFDVVAIGGWVFLWEAISTLAFEGRDAREKLKTYQRFSISEVRFTYTPATAT